MSDSFKTWILGKVKVVLSKPTTPAPFLLWCDPRREWGDLLKTLSVKAGFDLWEPSGDAPSFELLLRDRFHREERAPRVIWLPRAREDLTWFKVFEPEADQVWETRLIEALRDYGVKIPRDQEAAIDPLLPAHVREWFDRPKSTWADLTPGQAKGTLVDDERILQVLGGGPGEFDRLREDERFDIFARRCVEDFGLPRPADGEAQWRTSATATLLATDAAEANPAFPPKEGQYVVPAGPARNRALGLLRRWFSHIQYMATFEQVSEKADACLGLAHWARNLPAPPRSFASRAVEDAVFQQAVERFDRIEEVLPLAQALERACAGFESRERAFWGRYATKPVGWKAFVTLARSASVITECAEVHGSWKTLTDAVQWYFDRGWQLDHAGESLYLESPGFPAELSRVRARLRRAYLRLVDSLGRSFSDLLDQGTGDLEGIATAGEVAGKELANAPQTPTALVILDACRMDLGHRLASALNEGEPVERATVQLARAPLPTLTAIGMPFALPIRREALRVAWVDKGLQVTADGFEGDLSVASTRRKWLGDRLDVKEFLTIADVLADDKFKPAGKGRRLIAVTGAEFDNEGHDGRLALAGADEHVGRYALAIRRLRAAGYNRVVVVTDHGFFHWQPEEGEVEEAKVGGEVLAVYRRAALGRGLQHKSAIRMKVPGSDLEVAVPRSVNAFKTYGGLGYFHGGATLQEMIIPVIVARWPSKAEKVAVVLKPVDVLATETPRVQIATAGQAGLFGDVGQLARRVLVKVREPVSGKLVFRHGDARTLDPRKSEPETIQLQLSDPRPKIAYGTALVVEVRDADDEELLDHAQVTLKVDIDDW